MLSAQVVNDVRRPANPGFFRVYRSASLAGDAPASCEQMCTAASEMLFRPCHSAR